jgi:hypothetical protein
MLDRDHIKKSVSDYFVEVPGGLLTAAGIFYHIDSNGINQLVPGLLDKVRLRDLLQEADAQSNAFLFWGYYSLLAGLFFNIGIAAGALAIFGIVSYWLRPTLTGNPIGKIQVALVNEPLSYVVTAMVLIWFGFNELLLPMWTGLGAFLALRVVVVLMKGGKNHSFPSKNDRILHFVLQKHAMQLGLSTPAIDEMQNNLISYLNTTKRRKSDSKKST